MSKIKVALRLRPLLQREIKGGYPVVVDVHDNSAFITDIKVPERPSADSRQRFRRFDFDTAFWFDEYGDGCATQDEVYQEIGPSLEKSIVQGYNACLLAYGQSGTGKTHTMLGTKVDPGLIPRLCQGLWDKFNLQRINGQCIFKMEVSFMEIYREKIRDLFTTCEKTLKLREHPKLGPHVQDLTRVEITEELSLLDLLWEGECRRAVGSTGSNGRSSRSHAIWTLYLTSTKKNKDGTTLITSNQVHLVDLAGSEKADLYGTKNLLAEGKDINRSLVSLGNVISSLAEKSLYIPYRDSVLTFLLKDSLGGNSTTAIIITASPASYSHAQTLNSFRFAQRARLVENQPKVNIRKADLNSNNGSRKSSFGSGFLNGMSAFDLRRDISRLANMIRSAQGNGGILKGLTPRHGWNRLITALETWKHYDSSGQSNKSDRGSEDTCTSSSATVSKEDASTQDDLHMVTEKLLKPLNPLSRKNSSGKSRSHPNSPTKAKISGTEVFIPLSNSLRCLTWEQEEIHHLPKSLSDSEDEVFSSPPSSPQLTHNNNVRVNYLKNIHPVKFPTSHNLDSESRICEKIHGTIGADPAILNPIQTSPVEVLNYYENSPVIRNKYPTLVNPTSLPSLNPETVSELNLGSPKIVSANLAEPSTCQSYETTITKPISNYAFNIPKVSEFTKSIPLQKFAFESTDEDDEIQKEIESIRAQRRGRTIPSSCSRQQQEDIPSSYEDALFFSSSSSYESLQVNEQSYSQNHKVRVVHNCDFNFTEVEETINKLVEAEQEHHAASISCFPEQPHPPQLSELTVPVQNTFDGSSPSKFRNYFAKELHQIDNIGKQIKNLKQMTNKYNILKPYLDQIAEIDREDHSLPDEKLDQEIEKCSGWNIKIEYEKVQNEINAINKILKNGSKGTLVGNSGSSGYSNQDSMTTSSNDSNSIHSRRSSNASSTSNNNSINPHIVIPNVQHPLAFSTPKKLTQARQSKSSPTIHNNSSGYWSEMLGKTKNTILHDTHSDSMIHKPQCTQSQYCPKKCEQPTHRIYQVPVLTKTHNYLHHPNNTGNPPRPRSLFVPTCSSGSHNYDQNHRSGCTNERAQRQYDHHPGYRNINFPTCQAVNSNCKNPLMKSFSSESSSMYDDEPLREPCFKRCSDHFCEGYKDYGPNHQINTVYQNRKWSNSSDGSDYRNNCSTSSFSGIGMDSSDCHNSLLNDYMINYRSSSYY